MSNPGSQWLVVREVISSTNSGAQIMGAMPGLVSRLLDEEAWREFTAPGRAEPIRYDSFTAFVHAAPPKGLGGKANALVALCGADQLLRGRVERLLREEIEPARLPGRPNKERGTFNAVGRSETADKVTARLKREDPELANQVVAGEVSAYAAAREKGWRPPRIQVTTPERTAAHLRRHMSPAQLAELARLLASGQ